MSNLSGLILGDNISRILHILAFSVEYNAREILKNDPFAKFNPCKISLQLSFAELNLREKRCKITQKWMDGKK